VYSYDDNGNTISEETNGRVVNYSYDSRNRLRERIEGSQRSQFKYTYTGDRDLKVIDGVETNLIIDSNRPYSQVISEQSGSDTDVSYTYGRDLIRRGQSGESNYFHVDSIGSTRALTDENKSLTLRWDSIICAQGTTVLRLVDLHRWIDLKDFLRHHSRITNMPMCKGIL